MLSTPGTAPPRELTIGIAIKTSGDDQRHIAFLYRHSSGALHLSHLEWHTRFKDEPWDSSYHWARPTDLDEKIEGPVLAARLESIKKIQPSIPYGFDRRGCTFTVDSDGQLLFDAKKPGSGLTCATYILAVFDSMEMSLLSESTWEARPDDAAWQAKIIHALERTRSVQRAHIEAVKGTLGIERFRPEEVAGAFVGGPVPVDFQTAVRLAQEVIRDLEAA